MKIRLKIQLKTFIALSLASFAGLTTEACDVHDYWKIPDSLSVDEENARADAEKLNTDLFVRYQLDYEVVNTGSDETEVVVSGTSYVNESERTNGKKVWHLESGEQGEGILTSTMLQYGNSLQVSLLCCSQSSCNRSEVLCPESYDLESDGTDAGLFCYNACHDTSECIAKCPAEDACKEYCESTQPQHTDECMLEECESSGNIMSCSQYCGSDDDCLESCEPTTACADNCASSAAVCYKNCLSTWSACTNLSMSNEATTTVPCSICDQTLAKPKGCKYNGKTPELDESGLPILYVEEHDGTQHKCEGTYDCSKFPAQCLQDCEVLFSAGSDMYRMKCLDKCIQQHLFWCNDYTVLSEYIDARYDQPCCYSDVCHAEMTGIVKTMEVECFNDSSCSSNHYCSDEGICAQSEASSCSVTASKQSGLASFILLLSLGFSLVYLKKRSTSKKVTP